MNRTFIVWTIASALCAPIPASAGAFLKASDQMTLNPLLVMTPKGYDGSVTGTPTTITLTVCIDANSEHASEMVPGLARAVGTFNAGVPMTGTFQQDVLPFGDDFESVALHELLHCATGLAHTNIKLFGFAVDFTASTEGPNGVFNTNSGPDGLPGSPDDIRADDPNYLWFRKADNNPFLSSGPVEDCSTQPTCTYTVGLTDLPVGHSYAANATWRLSQEPPYSVTLTQAVMYRVHYVGAINRELTPDDVNTILMSRAGNDGQAGSGDDFVVQLDFLGIQDPPACDIPISFVSDVSEGVAICHADSEAVPATLANNRYRLLNMSIEFDRDITNAGTVLWYFGDEFYLFADDFESGDTSHWM